MTNLVWLIAAIVVSLVVIALALRLSRPLAAEIGRTVSSSRVTPSQTRLLARLLMVGLALVIAQTILRRAIAQILVGEQTEAPLEAGIAAAALAIVLLLLVWAYQAARPMLQTVTLRAIDAAIPTTAEALSAEPTRTSMSMVDGGPIPSPSDAVTLWAPSRGARPGPEASTTSPTVVAGRTNGSDGDETVVAGRAEDQATVVRPRPDDATLRRNDR